MVGALPRGKSMAGFQSTKGDPAGRETAEKPYKRGVFTRWRHIAPAGKGGAYQVLLRPATPGRPPLVTFFLYTHLSISISRISPDEIYCSRGSRTGSRGLIHGRVSKHERPDRHARHVESGARAVYGSSRRGASDTWWAVKIRTAQPGLERTDLHAVAAAAGNPP